MTAGQREAMRMMRELGLTLVRTRRSGHVVTDLLTPGGHPLRVVWPVTPSDRRSNLNQRAWLRRQIRELDGQPTNAP